MDKISKKDIISAINEIDSNRELRKGRASSTYDLIYKNVEYPPKLVISIANKFATGEELNPKDFDGGIDTPAFKLLEGFGFEIQKKRDPIKLLIENYKTHIKSTKLKDEVYKWELINEFKGKPNTDAVDFYQEVKSIKFKNLVYAMGIAVLNQLAKEKPEELRLIFKNLFDENKALNERISSFNEETLKIYRAIGETLQHHQDERSIATYLTYHNNEKYTLYKSSFYKRYCQLLGIDEAEKNKKYFHYLKLIDDLIENYIKADAELIGLVKSYIPKFYDGSNNKLLAQDILYTMLQKETNNEEVFEIIEEFVEQGKTTNLKTNSYPKTFNGLNLKVSFGQGVPARIPWIGLTKSPNTISKGIYPVFLFYKEFNKLILAYGISETEKSEFNWINTENHKTIKEWHLKEFNKNPDRYGASFVKGVYDLNIALDKELIEKDLKEIISEYNKLSFGSNYNKRQYWIYQPGKDALRWSDFYEEGIMGINWDELGDLKIYKSRIELRESLINNFGGEGSKKNDVSANDDFANKIRIDDIIIAKKGISTYLGYGYVSSEYYYDKDALDFKSRRKVNWIKKGEWIADHKIAIKTLTDISGDSKYIENVSKLIGIEMEEHKPKILKQNEVFNQILYGPPGTGKTYRLQKEYFDKFTIKETALSREQFLENLVQDLSWWQVISIAVLDLKSAKVNDIHNHELVKAKEKISNSKTIRPTIWGQLQYHTVLDCQNVNVVNRAEPLFFYKDEDSKWSIDNILLEQTFPEAFEILAKSKNFKADFNNSIKNYEFVTFHQSFSYEDFIEGIKPKLDDSEKDVSFEIKDGVFKKLCIKAEADLSNDYAIFIDEINRGNVSAIFGELITLIENDKRIGGANEIKVRLPYSKKEFGVPSNLYIIGTMNTADRSVEALDTALRRRFSFTEIMPDSTLLNKIEFKGFTLGQVLETINERIEVLLDRDHTIGHSYFLKLESGDVEGLKSVFANNIIPLLQEYFYHDYEKIALILGEGFIKIKENKTVKFANFKNIDSPEIANQFELISSIDDIENAIILLLNN
jgi:Cdc6-like AAA superfamily ATPase